MALTAEEQKELDMLNAAAGGGLSKAEQEELNQLNAAAGVGSQTAEDSPEVLNERHPEISVLSRAVYKNFGNDTASGMDYLKKQNPSLDFKEINGEIAAKRPDETQWRKLDPSKLELEDLSDIAYDTVAGIPQGIASAAAGIAAAPSIVGAVPAAMATNAATGAASEGIRQNIGKAFGTGATKAAIQNSIGKQIASGQISNLDRVAAENALKNTQRGAFSRLSDKLLAGPARGMAAFLSGENSNVIRQAYNNLDQIKAAEKDPSIRVDQLKNTLREVPRKLKEAIRNVGTEIGDMHKLIDESGEATLSTEEIKAPFKQLMSDILDKNVITSGVEQDFDKLSKIYNSEIADIPEKVTAEQMANLKNRLKGLAEKYGMNYKNGRSTVSATEGSSAIDSSIAHAFEGARQSTNDIVEKQLQKINPDIAAAYANKIDLYGALKQMGNENKSAFKTTKSLSNFLSSATKNPLDEQRLLDLQHVTGINLTDIASKEEAFRVFTNPSTEIRSLGGSTSTSRTLPLQIGGAKLAAHATKGGSDLSRGFWQGLGAKLGSSVASPNMLRKYMTGIKATRELPMNAPVGSYMWAPYVMKNMEENQK